MSGFYDKCQIDDSQCYEPVCLLAGNLRTHPLLLSFGERNKHDYPQAARPMSLWETLTSRIWVSEADLRKSSLNYVFFLDLCMEVTLCRNSSECTKAMGHILKVTRSHYLCCHVVPLWEDYLSSHLHPVFNFTFLAYPMHWHHIYIYRYTPTSAHTYIMSGINGDNPSTSLSNSRQLDQASTG